MFRIIINRNTFIKFTFRTNSISWSRNGEAILANKIYQGDKYICKEEIKDNLDKLTHYKFTFKNQNEDYLFESIELVNDYYLNIDIYTIIIQLLNKFFG